MAFALSLALFLLSLSLLLSTSAASNCSSLNSCNSPMGLCYSNFSSAAAFCSCRSGSYGSSCNFTAPASCPYASLNNTNATSALLYVGVSFDKDHLNIVVKSELVRARNYTLISIDESAIGNENCTYPGPHWSRNISNCQDVFLGHLPWSDNIPCGWTSSNSDPFFLRFFAQLLIEHHYFTEPFQNRTSAEPLERIVQHIQPLTIAFPKNIDVSAEFVLEAPVRLLQQVIKVDAKLSTIDFATNLVWPYYLVNFTVLSGPNATFTFEPSTLIDDCPLDGVSSCTQSFRVSISPEGACDINGEYQVQWNIACRQVNTSGASSCAYPPGSTINGSFSIVSGKTCATVSTTVPISGGLAAYDDAAQSVYNPENLIGAVMYYRAKAASSNVTVTGVSINTVKITSTGEPDIFLLLNTVPVEPGFTNSEFKFGEAGLEFADFSFVLSLKLFPNLPEGSTRLYTTRIIADVDYISPTTNKRGVMEVQFGADLNTQPIAIASQFNLKRPYTAGHNSASYLSAGLALLMPLITLILFIDSRLCFMLQ